ncbi:MAG: SGNH/GDSL hydrolase family protein [Malacoplasma sp.]|nr:SGNH/GDSL hydrolase family protein [Malacoplasma sp.]MDE6893915.1 SGNH/GDSL hydrolase family protein [Malacoplasma sp.]MDE7087975.1 SGNH/GDSL hydrolase family protein [Malacoplasma sp.]
MKSKKLWKWIGFFSSFFAITGVAIAAPFIASTAFFTNYRNQHADEYETLRYQIPQNLGSAVADSAFAYADNADRISLLPGDNKKFQDAIENTYLFAGGKDFFPNWDVNKNFRNVVGMYEENVRWTMASQGGNNPSAAYTSLGRFCINIAKPYQTLKDINDNYDFRVKNLSPKNVVMIIGTEYAEVEDINKSLDQFENDLRIFVNNVLQLRNNTSNLIFMKHWKIPNPNNDEKIAKYNDNISKLNKRANRILSELTDQQIPRVLLVDNEDLFTNLQYQYSYEYVNPDFTLTRIGSNEVAKSILKTMKPWNTVTNAEWVPANWTDYSKTHLNAKPVQWSTLKSKNNLKINIDNVNIANNIATLLISFKEGGVKNGDQVNWMFEYTKLGTNSGKVIVKDSAIVQDEKITIDNINVYTNDLYATAPAGLSNDFVLTVFDADGNAFDIVEGNLDTSNTIIQNNANLKADASTDSNDAKSRFMKRFNDKSKPLVWTFIGDSIDHGALHNQGFDTYPESVQKSVMNDWKRYDDIFVNAAQSGNFTNRQIDPYLLQADIFKYKPDVISIGLGITDGVVTTNLKNGQVTYVTPEQYVNNMKTIIQAAIKANPEVVVVINGINPTDVSARRNIPTTYNPKLQETFAPANGESEFKDYVIYNQSIYDELNNIETNWTYTKKDQLFLASDNLHPSGNANLVKAKSFLNALGVDVDDSYITNYTLEEFVWYTGSTTSPFQPIGLDTTSSEGNKISPDIKSWSNLNPLGMTGGQNRLANTFLSYTNTNGREYWLLTDYKIYDNNYRVLLEDGEYTTGAWAVPTAPMSNSTTEFWGGLTPNGSITVSKNAQYS